MKKQTTQRKQRGLLALVSAAAVVAAACVLALPTAALAEETGVAHTVDSNGMRHYYNSVGEAISAGYSTGTVYMDADWDLGPDRLEIADSKSITIQMAGHKITGSYWYAVIHVNEHASLTITSYEPAKEYTYYGYAKKNESDLKSDDWGLRELTVTTSGLISNTRVSGGRGINLEKDAKLTLENVAVAGCSDGALYMCEGCVANLSNTSVCHNSALVDEPWGGGVSMKDSCTLSLNASHIDSNYAKTNGGGVYANSGAQIYLENGSTISGNGAGKGGGAIYVNQSFFTIKSADGTGAMVGNASYVLYGEGEKKDRNGGAIHIDGSSGNNEGLIEGIAIKGNYSNSDAGGIFLDQRWTTVRNCVIADNLANTDGGGARVNGDNVTFENCTVTGNVCDLTGNDRMGGGIKVDYDRDVTLRGTCVVKGNLRDSDGKADDIYLDSFVSRAYIKGSLDQGSSVGVRTDHNGDLRIAKSFSCATKDGLFSDESGYYVSYGTDEGGDAWQRRATKEFTATVNGQGAAKYKQGTKATLVAPATTGDLVFWHWDLDKTTGLYPIGDYVTDEAAFSNTLTFKMPQNDVDAVPVYVTRAKKVAVVLEAPAAGEALPAAASLYRMDGAGLRGPFAAAVAWYEVAEDGTRPRATGAAKAGTAYAAEVTVKGDSHYGLYFNSSVAAGDVTLEAGSGDSPAVESASVDSGTGALTVKTAAFAKTAGEAADVKTGQVTVNVEKRALLDGASEAAALSDDAGGDKYVVTYTYTDESDEVTITAPAVEGHNFACWEDTGSGYVEDGAALDIKVSALLGIDSLTAVYTPVATKVEVDMAAPAAGEGLADTAADVRVSCWDGQEGSFAEALDVDGFKVTWAPEPDDGVAAPGTTYTALIEICDADGVADAERAMATDAVVTCGGVKATAAGFVVVDGKFCLAVALPPTAAEPEEPAEPDVPGEADGDETDDADKSDESGKADEADANEGQVDDQPATTVTTTTAVTKTARKGTPSTGDVTFTAASALLATSAICLAAATISRRNQR